MKGSGDSLTADGKGVRPPAILGRPGHLVDASTGDGVRLHGFLQRPDDRGSEAWLWIIVPGVAGNFYSSTLLTAISDAVLDAGHASLRVNTSGRDQIAFASRGGFPAVAGSAFEKMADAVEDLRGWCRCAADIGYQRVGLIGHSLGAIKILKYLWADDAAATSIGSAVLLSPPRLNHELLRNDPRHGANFVRDYDAARTALQSGEPERLLRIRFPQPLYISAGTFIDKYGPQDEHDYMVRCQDMSLTTAWIFGEQEVRGQRANFADCDRMLLGKLNPRTNQIIVVPGADHNYADARATLREELGRIFDRALIPPRPPLG